MAALGNQSVTLLRAPLVKDPRSGQFVRDWANATTTVVKGCSVQPFAIAQRLNFEFQGDREYTRGFIRCYAPPETDVLTTDRAVYNGNEYDIFGFPDPWVDLEGKPEYVAFILRRREG